MTLWVVIVLFFPLTVQGSMASASQQVTRLNYGVTFTLVRQVKVVSDLWIHVFDLHLPEPILRRPDLRIHVTRCDNATSNEEQVRRHVLCEQNRALILEFHRQYVHMTEEISQAIQHIYHLLPADRNIPRNKLKRALLPIGGSILSGLFGTVSEDDLKPIKEHMTRIAQGISHLGHLYVYNKVVWRVISNCLCQE